MLLGLFVRYGYAMVFVAAAIEGDATLVTAAFLAHRGYLDLDLVMIAAAGGTIAGNQAYFWLARRYARQHVVHLRSHRVYGRVLAWMDTYGLLLVAGSRFLYGFRIAIPSVCGANGMSPVAFAIGDAGGAVVWTLIIGLAGYAIGHVLEIAIADLRAHEWWVALALLIGGLALLAWRRDRLPRRSKGSPMSTE